MTQEQVALELGIGDQLTRISESDVMNWMQRGVVVQLHISHWRPYASLNEEDLGITNDQTTENYIQLGRKKLLPPKIISKLESLEMKARTNLRLHSFACPWGRFVPASTWQTWYTNNEALKQSFYEIRDELVAALPDSVNQLRDIYTTMAEDAYKRLSYDKQATAPVEFIEKFITQCINKIPQSDIVSQTFRYQELFSYLPLWEQAVEYVQESLSGEVEMKRAVAEQMVSQRKEMITDFITEVSGSLRSMIVEACTKVKESLEKNEQESLPGATKKMLSNVLDKVNSLNFYNDQQVDKMVMDVRSSLTQYDAGPFKDVKSVATAIESVLITSRAQLDQIEKWRPSRFAAIELEG